MRYNVNNHGVIRSLNAFSFLSHAFSLNMLCLEINDIYKNFLFYFVLSELGIRKKSNV